jgi:hypothetical protein
MNCFQKFADIAEFGRFSRDFYAFGFIEKMNGSKHGSVSRDIPYAFYVREKFRAVNAAQKTFSKDGGCSYQLAA